MEVDKKKVMKLIERNLFTKKETTLSLKYNSYKGTPSEKPFALVLGDEIWDPGAFRPDPRSYTPFLEKEPQSSVIVLYEELTTHYGKTISLPRYIILSGGSKYYPHSNVDYVFINVR